MMRAARIVFAKELRQMWRDARLAVAICAGVLLVAAMAFGALKHYQADAEERAHATQGERDRWLALRDYGPHGAAHHGVYAFRPESPLSAFDPGVAEYLGVSVWLEAHKQNSFVYRPAQDAAPAKRFGDMTPANALQILGPLLIILLGFDSFAGERDHGTLRQLLSLGAPRRALLLGKAAAVGGVALALIAPALLVVAVAHHEEGALDWSRFALLAIVYLAYLATFVGLTLAVSARVPSARASLAILLGVWIVNCFVVPRAATEIAAFAHPLPASVAWESAMKADLRDGHAEATEQKVKQELLTQYGVAREQDLPINWRGVMLQRGEEQNYRTFDAHFSGLFDGVRRQDALYQWGGLIAPVLALQSLSMGLAESDAEHHWRFVRAAENHRRLIQKTLNAELTQHPEKEWGDYKGSPELWASVPEFRYGSPLLADVAPVYAPALLVLAFWLAVAWVAALRAAKDMRP